LDGQKDLWQRLRLEREAGETHRTGARGSKVGKSEVFLCFYGMNKDGKKTTSFQPLSHLVSSESSTSFIFPIPE
jgi:hypothetical protein